MTKKKSISLNSIPKRTYPVIFVAVFALLGVLILTFSHAASTASLTLTPSTASVATGDTFQVTVKEASGSDQVNAVEADLTYDQTKIQFVSSDVTSSAFGIEAQNTGGGGTVSLARGTVTPVIGSQTVAVLTFKALAAGSAAVNFANSSAVVTSTANANILVTKTGATYTVTGTTVPTAPAAPTGLTSSTHTSTSVTLAWSVSTGATSYKVYRDGNTTTPVGTPTTTSFTDTGLSPGTTHTYTVAATNSVGTSGQSNSVSVTTSAATPATPAGLNVTGQTSTTVSLSWTASSGATGYKIYRNGGTTPVGTPTGTTFTDTGLTASTTYQYTIAAYNGTGTSAVSSQVPATTSASTGGTAPAAPNGLALNNAISLNMKLTWTASSGATGYNIYRNGTKINTSTTNSYTDVDAALKGNTSYTYTVAAFNGSGTSAQSASASSKVLRPGDVDGDGTLNAVDVARLSAGFKPGVTGKARINGDLNGDGIVDGVDVGILSYYFSRPIP